MRKLIAVLVLLALFLFSGCFSFLNGMELITMQSQETTEIVVTLIPGNTEAEVSATEGEGYSEEEHSGAQQEESSVAEISTSDEVHQTTRPQESTTSQEATTVAEELTGSQQMTEVDLGISMPEKNGTMVVDSSVSNKFIQIVEDKKDIDPSLLVAVYSVPESGQNYVFEFYDDDGREADDIRRVYLIDSSGKITGIAAVKASERENVSSVENWFCMNVLIKELVYPAVKDELN